MLEPKERLKDTLQNVTQVSSTDALWDAFNREIVGSAYSRWRYISDQGFKPMKDAEEFRGVEIAASFGKDITDLGHCAKSAKRVQRWIMEILRHAEHPVILEDILNQMIISVDTVTTIRELLNITLDETLFIIPCFGPGLSAGYFIFVQTKNAEHQTADEKLLLSLQCQLTHNHYRRLTAEERQTPSPLSDREAKILALMAKGYSNSEIAGKLSISAHVINVYVKLILKKTQSRNRTTAVLNGMALGLIQ
jgi:DNA-binding CsgD family transcriptional regulator